MQRRRDSTQYPGRTRSPSLFLCLQTLWLLGYLALVTAGRTAKLERAPYDLNWLRLPYSDQKGPDINGLNKKFLNNYSSYAFQL